MIGSTGSGSADIDCDGDLGPVKIGGDLVGGVEAFTGRIVTNGQARFGDHRRLGDRGRRRQQRRDFQRRRHGSGENRGRSDRRHVHSAGQVHSDGKIVSVSIGGSLVGGIGGQRGAITAAGIGPVKIGGDLGGGAGNFSGQIYSSARLGSVSVGGSMLGGAGERQRSDPRRWRHRRGEDRARPGWAAGEARGGSSAAARSASVSIGGSVSGGVGNVSGEIHSDGDMGAVTIGRDLVGGSGRFGRGEQPHWRRRVGERPRLAHRRLGDRCRLTSPAAATWAR